MEQPTPVKTVKLVNGNIAHVCSYKIVKGIRKGQECGIVIRGSEFVHCNKHRRVYDYRRNRIETIKAMGIGAT